MHSILTALSHFKIEEPGFGARGKLNYYLKDVKTGATIITASLDQEYSVIVSAMPESLLMTMKRSNTPEFIAGSSRVIGFVDKGLFLNDDCVEICSVKTNESGATKQAIFFTTQNQKQAIVNIGTNIIVELCTPPTPRITALVIVYALQKALERDTLTIPHMECVKVEVMAIYYDIFAKEKSVLQRDAEEQERQHMYQEVAKYIAYERKKEPPRLVESEWMKIYKAEIHIMQLTTTTPSEICKVCEAVKWSWSHDNLAENPSYPDGMCQGCLNFICSWYLEKYHYTCQFNKKCSVKCYRQTNCDYCKMRKCISTGIKVEDNKLLGLPSNNSRRVLLAFLQGAS